MRKYIVLFVSMICLLSLEAHAQKERKHIRSGNDLFDDNKYENSEVEYRKALGKKLNSYEAGFNLGDALYKQKKYDEALKQFQTLAVTEKDPEKLSHLFHNMGNTLLMNKKVDESIEAYKQSLRFKPDSKETKYNLEYARWMKKKQEEEEKKKNQQNKDQQNKDQDKKDQDKKDQDKKDQDKKDQDKKDQNKQDQNKKDQQKKDQQKKDQQKKDQQKKDQQNKPGDKDKKKQQGQQPKISKEDAKRLLDALQNDEKKVQEKVQKARAKAQKAKKSKIKKDW